MPLVSISISCSYSSASNNTNSCSNTNNPGSMVVVLDLNIIAHLTRHSDLHRDAHLARHRDADLMGSWDTDLPWDGMAGLSGDLPCVLDRPLLTLPLCVGVALRTCAVSSDGTVAGLCIPLAHWVTSVASGEHLGVVTHNSRAVMHLLGNLVALLSHNILAVFHVGRVHHSVKLRMANLILLRVANLVVLRVASLIVLSVAGSVNLGVVESLALGVLGSIGISSGGISSIVHSTCKTHSSTHSLTSCKAKAASADDAWCGGCKASDGKENIDTKHLCRENIFPPVERS